MRIDRITQAFKRMGREVLQKPVRYLLNKFDDGNVPTTGCEKYSTLARCWHDDKLIPKKHSFCQNSILASCSLYKASSVIGANIMDPRDGYIFPPGFKNLSLAKQYDSNILSCTSKKPIGSDIITSTCSGISTSSILPRSIVITSPISYGNVGMSR